MPSTMYLKVRSAEGASQTTHGADAKSFFSWERRPGLAARRLPPGCRFRACEKCRTGSFRGAGAAHEPGINEHRPAIARDRSVCIGSGPALPGIPE